MPRMRSSQARQCRWHYRLAWRDRENNNVHDHWVDGFGNRRHHRLHRERAQIEISAHTARSSRSNISTATRRQGPDYSVITVISQQGASGATTRPARYDHRVWQPGDGKRHQGGRDIRVWCYDKSGDCQLACTTSWRTTACYPMGQATAGTMTKRHGHDLAIANHM